LLKGAISAACRLARQRGGVEPTLHFDGDWIGRWLWDAWSQGMRTLLIDDQGWRAWRAIGLRRALLPPPPCN
jgi:hypothetical protein